MSERSSSEVERAAQAAYEASAEPEVAQTPWSALTAAQRSPWLALAAGDAGAAVD